MFGVFRRWKPKGQMYSLRCFQCGSGFLSSFNLEAPTCGKCMQKTKSLDSTVDYEKMCSKCGNRGVIYRKEMCHSFEFRVRKERRTSVWISWPYINNQAVKSI
jgi:hypothetical protein